MSEPRTAPSEPLIGPAEAISPIPIHVMAAPADAALDVLGPVARAYASATGFKGKAGALLLAPGSDGGLERVLCAAGGREGLATVRGLPSRLPDGDYRLLELPDGIDRAQAALAWAQGCYAFDRYKADHARKHVRLVVEDAIDLSAGRRLAHACALARDMVNTPASDMGPLQIETIAREIAHGAQISVCTGEALLRDNYPAVHAVGRAAAPDRAPRIIELTWRGSTAAADAPLIALIGKGVTFDTGGLDLKPSAGMRLMKKDMGGAAHAIALARMIMGADLPVRLTLLVPAVENAVSADAVRPGDVLNSRAGVTIEVGNTDAEGRLILADALTRAGELSPDLTIDLATLTGAARVALGPQVIPFYTPDEELAAEMASASLEVSDPLWRMPLWDGYRGALNSDIAELKNDPDAWAQAGSVTAALFLQRFAPATGSWLHLDVFAWNPKSRPGYPVGAEAQGILAIFHLLQRRHPA